MKKIRRPLTDINGCDFLTGQKIEAPKLKQEKNLQERVQKWLEKKIEESEINGKIYVEGLGYVSISSSLTIDGSICIRM